MRPGDDGSAVDERAVPLLVFAILGAGFLLLFAGVDWFWMVWVFGFAVVLPAVAILLGEDDEADREPARARDSDRDRGRTGERDDEVADALETLRERYARGDLSEEQFETKLEALLETETPEDARERLRRRRTERERGDASERAGDERTGEPERERGPDADRERERERER
jgi:uncharacterized membrane protein